MAVQNGGSGGGAKWWKWTNVEIGFLLELNM